MTPTSTPRRADNLATMAAGEIETRYVDGGRKAHYVNVVARHVVALCGVSVARYADWFGSGTQQEHDKRAAMPICARCARQVGGPL